MVGAGMVNIYLQFFLLIATSVAVQVSVEDNDYSVKKSGYQLMRKEQKKRNANRQERGDWQGYQLMRKEQKKRNANRQELGDGQDFVDRETGRTFWGHKVISSSRALSQRAPVLEPPSTEPYNLKEPSDFSFSQYKQDLNLLPILEQLSPGFFVESGGLDGKFLSNTLYYERHLGWKGLLVEPDPRSFGKIHSENHRHAYAFNGCLSPTGHAENLKFDVEGEPGHSRINGNGNTYNGHIDRTTSVNAQPLHSLLETIGQNAVDFWSLDIEGSEGKVLKATDFSKIEVGVLLIEMNKKNDANINEIREVMTREGFINLGQPEKDIYDQVFINPKYFQKRGLAVPTHEMLSQKDRN